MNKEEQVDGSALIVPCTGEQSNNTLIQKKIDNPNIQYPVIIIPAFAYIMAHNDLGEGIAGQCKGLVFGFCFSCIVQSIGGLDISLFAAQGAMKSISRATCTVRPFLSLALP